MVYSVTMQRLFYRQLSSTQLAPPKTNIYQVKYKFNNKKTNATYNQTMLRGKL